MNYRWAVGTSYCSLQVLVQELLYVCHSHKTMSCAKVYDEIRLNRFNSTVGCSLCLANTQIEN